MKAGELKNVRMVINTCVPAGFDEAILACGFDSRAQFIRQAARAIIKVHAEKAKMDWPLQIKTL